LRYEILGTLRICDGGRSSSISAKQMEILLAALLVRRNQTLSIAQLITEIWGENPPQRAHAALHVYISHLRKLLRRPSQTESPIVTWSPGYYIQVDSGELDLDEFTRHVNQARSSVRAGQYAAAEEASTAALKLWRGPALDRVRDGPIVSAMAMWLDETRIECTELLIESGLALGRERELIGQLYALTSEYPLQETFYRQLMLALYRSERQADALEVYRIARELLNSELGVEPGPNLKEVQRAILLADERLLRPTGLRRAPERPMHDLHVVPSMPPGTSAHRTDVF
jgi:SARP family transcriptional regulator, regulator of embCAB operon